MIDLRKLLIKKISRSGYKIHTTIDKKVYDRMQKAAHDYKGYGSDQKGNLQQVASVLIKNDSGKILGFVAGRDYEQRNLNLATQTYRSNGSTMKPLAVYAPAMEMGLTQPGATVADLPLPKPEKGYYQDFGNNYHGHGLESTRKALYESHNIPAVRTYVQNMKHGDSRDYLQKMGFNWLVGADHQTLGIGGLTRGTSVEENTNAFTTFGNNGKFKDAYMIDKIVDKNGKTLYKHKAKPKRIFSRQTNFLMLDMMRDVLHKEGATAAGLPAKLKFQADWAGKTGTSQNQTDEWFVGTNPNVTLGLWTGYVQHIQMDYNRAANRTQQLWADMANAAYDVHPKLMAPDDRFSMPSGIVQRSVCKVTGKLPSKACKKAGLVRKDYFNEKYVPTEKGDAIQSKGDQFSLKKNYIADHFYKAKDEDFYKYLPEGWSNFVPPDQLKEESKDDDSKPEDTPKDDGDQTKDQSNGNDKNN